RSRSAGWAARKTSPGWLRSWSARMRRSCPVRSSTWPGGHEPREYTVDFALSDEQREVRDWVRTFVRREIMPLEPEVLRRERQGGDGLERAEVAALQGKGRQAGFRGVLTPVEHGGMGLGPVMAAIVWSELGRSFVPFEFGGTADNILYFCNDVQRKQYLLPTISGERISCFAITEPGAGADAKAIRTSAVRDGRHWVINGEKAVISKGNEADFCMVFAVTDKEKGADGGITCFLVDRDMGWKSEAIATMGEWGPAALVFEDVRVPAENVLGEVGEGFALAMQWIGAGRYLLPARALGACERLLQLAVDYANTRETFGAPLAERQAIQWMVADSAVEIEALRWLVLNAAWRQETGQDTRHAASMAKLYGGGEAHENVDPGLQIHRGVGDTTGLPGPR